MKVFVTGATGFVGAHLVEALLARGDEVRCLVRSPEKARALGWSRVRTVPGDLDDAAALRAGCAGADIIYHVAGRTSASGVVEYMAANRDGTGNVLEAAAETSPRRFLLVSSLAAAGPTERGRPIDESRPPAPVTDYGRSKLAAEVLVRAAPLPWTIVRPPIVYGERDRAILKAFKLVRLGIVPRIGDGAQQLSLVYAGDLAEALIAAAESPETAGRVYFAAHATPTTSGELFAGVRRALGRDRAPRVVKLPPLAVRAVLWAGGTLARLVGRSTILSPGKAAEFLAPAWICRSDALARDAGWRARTDLDAGLRRTAQWYQREGWL